MIIGNYEKKWIRWRTKNKSNQANGYNEYIIVNLTWFEV